MATVPVSALALGAAPHSALALGRAVSATLCAPVPADPTDYPLAAMAPLGRLALGTRPLLRPGTGAHRSLHWCLSGQGGSRSFYPGSFTSLSGRSSSPGVGLGFSPASGCHRGGV